MRIALVIIAALGLGEMSPAFADEAVYLDGAGVVRWTADQSEVALFGANYCLPSASDYRAAGRVGSDRRRLIERDLAHFARMGWDGMRVALWGDWENSDRQGNLIANDHLDLMDYLIHQAKQRGISVLFTPIHTHSALWPDGRDGPHIQGFSKHFPRADMGRDPAAIAAQVNYLRQILEHVNPYTDIALKDEPAIVFIELINEPWHHPEDPEGAVAYINALVDAVRSTGCSKLLFHNLSQDFGMIPAIRSSRVQGVSFGWYPTALLAGRTLKDNFLRWVDVYPPMEDERISHMPRIVYEFDAADTLSPAMYPAMVRTFRGVGAQFAAMFAYDMLDTAPFNLGWQTHYLNLVYTPRKAMGGVIAAEAMRRLPRGDKFGPFPANTRFGPFGVSPTDGQRAWMVTPETMLYAGDCDEAPPSIDALQRIAGVGRSAVVDYEGTGAYFLDRIEKGAWRLEVYPDAVLVQDPFAQRLNDQTVSSQLVWRAWPMRLQLPDLGDAFLVEPLNAGNGHRARATDGRFDAWPGVYLLLHDDTARPAQLPERLGRLGFAEFICPAPGEVVPRIVSHVRDEYVSSQGAAVPWEVDVVTSQAPESVALHVQAEGDPSWRVRPMARVENFRYRADVAVGVERVAWFVEAQVDGRTVRYPADEEASRSVRLVAPDSPLVVFAPARDYSRLFTERRAAGAGEWPLVVTESRANALPALRFSGSDARTRVGWSVRDAIEGRMAGPLPFNAVRIRGAGSGRGSGVTLVLIERDGTSWSAALRLGGSVREHVVPLNAFSLGGGSKLPLGYPGDWNTALPPAQGRWVPRDGIRLDELQHMQLVFEPVSESGATRVEAIALTVEAR